MAENRADDKRCIEKRKVLQRREEHQMKGSERGCSGGNGEKRAQGGLAKLGKPNELIEEEVHDNEKSTLLEKRIG